jgi:ABC-2 type transport system ATP-binding protein
MPQTDSLYDDLSAQDNIRFFAKAYGIKDVDSKAKELLELVELERRARHKIYTFSGGMRKRISLACALVHDPKLLFLDEPTAAVDPELKLKLWELFRELSARGHTLFISTHLMDEAMYCDEVAILQEGKMIFSSTPDKFLQRGHSRVTITDKSGKITSANTLSEPKDLARLLQNYGLKKDVDAIQIRSESFEEIMLKIAGRKK